MASHKRDDGCSCCHQLSPPVTQTLDEMDFERGVWQAASDGDVKRVEELLRRGKHPDAADGMGFTALHYASRNGHVDICRLLLEAGADVDCVTSGKATPLQRSSYQGHLDVCKLLLVNGCDPEKVDVDGNNALHKAAEGGQTKVMNYLLAHYPKLNEVANNRGHVPSDLYRIRQQSVPSDNNPHQ